MKRIYTLLLMMMCIVAVRAQNIAVEKFYMDERDLTANTAGSIVMDQNGQKCALIKIETTQQDFSFEVGSLGVVKTEQHVGEVWVYVPEGVRRISIFHQQLGTLRNYQLGQSVKSARTYIMKLTTGEVQTIVKKSRTSQYVVFQLQPQNAVVTLNGEMLQTAAGTATKMMRFGTYDYQVQAPDYHSATGRITVNDPKQKHVVNVQLQPNFAQVTLTVGNNAEIWVNGERKGTGSWTGNLGAGTYEMETRLAGHRPSTITRDITVTTEPQTIKLEAPSPIYGEADINSTPAMADIYIDDNKVGQTPQLISQLQIGEHQVRLVRQGFADYNATIHVREGETASLAAALKEQERAAVPATAPVADSNDRRVITVGKVQFTMIRVEGGTFQMGATEEQGSDAWDSERPVHQVTLSPYYIGETEVTQELWEAVMGKNPSFFKGSSLPVECVSWKDCQKFIEKLNKKTGLSFRLPTEAEWEYAARGGNKSQEYKYSGSNNLDEVAWYSENSGNKTHAVKVKKSNELGLFDMSGNVREWCQDCFGNYNVGSQTNPQGVSLGSDHVYRGGGWYFNARNCRVSSRYIFTSGYRLYDLGLRLAL